MTGRGRPRKAKSPDTKCAKGKTRPEEVKQEARCPGKDLTEEKKNGTTKEQKPKAPVQQSKAKTKEERTETQPETPKDPEAKKHARKAKEKVLEVQYEPKAKKLGGKNKEKGLEVQQEKPTDIQDKKHGGKNKEKVLEEETPKDTTKACVPQDKVDSILSTTLDKLKIKRDKRSGAAEVINDIVKIIIAHLKQNTQCFKEVEELRTGSYYENLKISNPDEFDVMLTIPLDRVNITPFGDNGAFYSVELKRGTSHLMKFQEANTLSATKMLDEFREEVKKSVKQSKQWELEKKKRGCPAVTLTTTVQSVTISLDIVLSLMVKSSWPPFTNDGIKIEGWLGTKVKQELKRKPYYLVPKYEGRGTVEKNGVLAKDTWRVSFSHVEKAILKNHGSEKTCCERGGARCCRKDCLKLLKHLLSQLKEEDKSLDKFCSYHAKTTLLHACCSRTKDSDWLASSLGQCFRLLLGDFVTHLEKGELSNFFIPTQNLLSGPGQKMCSNLARRIKEECEQGFPIFN